MIRIDPVKNLSRIFLVGTMGCGKTTVGQELAKRLQWKFADSDRICEEQTGMSISQIFATEGENAFRKYEANIISELSKQNNLVLATGGGVVLMSENCQRLQDCGTVIFLDASIETQVANTNNSNTRPLLADGNRRETLKKLYHERKPLYQEVADFQVITDNQSWQQITDKILTLLEANK